MNTIARCTAFALALASGALIGCAGGPEATIREPLAVSSDWNASVDDRVAAVKAAWRQAASGEADRSITRDSLERLAWDLKTPELVRAAALESVLWDEAGEAQSIELVQKMLPTEPGRLAVAVMATAAADHQWTETTAALVRSLGRPVEGVELHERSERQALERVHPDSDLGEVVLGVFLDPQADPGPGSLRLDMRAREAAWGLLTSSTPDVTRRAELLARATPPDEESNEIVSAMLRLHSTFGVLPSNGEELRWTMQLVDDGAAAWWEQAASRVGRGGGAESLYHLEPMRWAAVARPSWASAGAASLESELADRLVGRQVYARLKSVEGIATANAERFSRARSSLSRGDMLVLLVLDEVFRDPEVIGTLFEGADADYDDRASEHGGLILADGDRFLVQPFVPRGAAAGDDRRFVAPRDMIDRSATALTHFHYHATSRRNRDYAGPSPADIEYAERFGRACVSLTSLSASRLNVDVYFPSGVVVDLGAIERPSGSR